MSEPRPAPPRALVVGALVVGAVLVLLGLVCWGLYAVQAGRESAAYAAGGKPPGPAHVTAGKTYWLAVPDGVQREATLGVSPGALQCTATPGSGAAVSLQVAAEHSDSKAIDQIASFTAPLSGDISVQCTGLGAVYVGNPDGAFDWSGLWLVLASLALVVGLPFTLSGLRGIARPVPVQDE